MKLNGHGRRMLGCATALVAALIAVHAQAQGLDPSMLGLKPTNVYRDKLVVVETPFPAGIDNGSASDLNGFLGVTDSLGREQMAITVKLTRLLSFEEFQKLTYERPTLQVLCTKITTFEETGAAMATGENCVISQVKPPA